MKVGPENQKGLVACLRRVVLLLMVCLVWFVGAGETKDRILFDDTRDSIDHNNTAMATATRSPHSRHHTRVLDTYHNH